MIALWGWRRIFLAYLVSAAACGIALGGFVSVRLSQRFLRDLLLGSTARGTFPIDGSTALAWGDTLFAHDRIYGLFLLGAAVLAFCAFALRDPSARRPDALPLWALHTSIFGIGALASAQIDRMLTKEQFDPSHVTASRVLEPFYAYDMIYQQGAFALVGAIMVVWLGWMLSHQGTHRQRQAR